MFNTIYSKTLNKFSFSFQSVEYVRRLDEILTQKIDKFTQLKGKFFILLLIGQTTRLILES